mmetsp:Transcript_122272/g.182715  ORF Transcript_122272/g.182715 Transcript_122272/m.182715 type:complete len:94 (-) Transcript_122272:443-724(-)
MFLYASLNLSLSLIVMTTKKKMMIVDPVVAVVESTFQNPNSVPPTDQSFPWSAQTSLAPKSVPPRLDPYSDSVCQRPLTKNTTWAEHYWQCWS